MHQNVVGVDSSATAEAVTAGADSPRRAATVASKVGQLPLHAAAGGGCWRCVALLHNAAPKAAAVKDRRDQMPAQIAARRGHTVSAGCAVYSDHGAVPLVPCMVGSNRSIPRKSTEGKGRPKGTGLTSAGGGCGLVLGGSRAGPRRGGGLAGAAYYADIRACRVPTAPDSPRAHPPRRAAAAAGERQPPTCADRPRWAPRGCKNPVPHKLEANDP